MIIILRLKRELCPGGFQQTHRCIRKIQLKLFPIFFFSFHPNVQTICSSFIKIDNTCTTRCVDINVYFILKDSFIHRSFTQRNSHLFFYQYSSITHVHYYKIYPYAKFHSHLLEDCNSDFLRNMAHGNISNSFAMEIDRDQTAGYIVSRKSRYFI